MLDKIPELVQLDLTHQEIADILQVTQPTVTNWLNKHPEFFIKYRLEQAKLNNRVKSSLCERALGMEIEEKKVHESPNGISKTITKKQIPPDTAAAQYWLENKMPGQWKRTPDTVINNIAAFHVEHSDGKTETITVKQVANDGTEPQAPSLPDANLEE